MKKYIFFLVFANILLFAQNSKIYPKNKVILGEENTFVYEPQRGTSIPDNAFVHYLYKGGERKSPLKKISNKFEFSMIAPDSIRTMVMMVKNPSETFKDTNSNNLYTYNLIDKKDGKTQIDRLLLMDFVNYLFKIDYPWSKVATEYENVFKAFPQTKTDENYSIYLNALNIANPDLAKPVMRQYAEKMQKRTDEKSLISAYNIYNFSLKELEKAEALSKLILEKYPNGNLAKRDFVRNFFGNLRKSPDSIDENAILQAVSDFNRKFPKDKYDDQWTNQMYGELLKKAIMEKNGEKMNRYSQLFSEPFFAAREFNGAAWRIADGDNLASEGNDLEYAEQLARKSLEIYHNKMNNLSKYEVKSTFDETFMYYTDALAMVLYKEKKYQEAFDEQSKLINFDFIDDGNRERYVLYAEKAKGNDFVKNYIDGLLKKQNISENLYNKLVEIYKSKNLPISEIEKLREENKKIATKKAKEELIKIYGTDLKAKEFTLTNLEGKTLKLSDYRGKIIVLDFWATWCGPCREAMPHMQKIVNNYKGQNVEFFFINTLETAKPAEIQKNVSKFITDNKYDFNVLFDFQDEVAKKYKVQGIPCEIIIDKEGNIISRSVGYDGNLEALIRENL